MSLQSRQFARIAELEAQNAALQVQLAHHQSDTAHDQNVTPEERYESLATKYNDLFKQYGDLETRHKRCDLHIQLVEKKYRHAKDVVRQWDQYIAYKNLVKQGSKSKQDGPATPVSLSDLLSNGMPVELDTNATPRAAVAKRGRDDAQAHDALHNSSAERAPASSHVPPQLKTDVVQPEPRTSTLRVTSSQTTDAGSDPIDMPSSPPGKQEPSSDSEPVVVSTRSLKRKRTASSLAMPPPVRIKQEAGSPEKPVEVKSEDYSSPILTHRSLVRQETSDLDAIIDYPLTPKKHRRDRRAVSEEVRRPPTLMTRVSSLSDSEMLDDGQAMPPDDAGVTDSLAASGYQAATINADPALQPISINVPPDKAQSRSAQKIRKSRQSDQDAASKAALLSEDGESQNVVAASKAHQTPHRKPAELAKAQRLDSLLMGPQSSRQQLTSNLTPKPAFPRQKGLITPVSLPATRVAQTDKPSAKPQITPSLRRRPVASTNLKKPAAKLTRPFDDPDDSPPPVRPEDEPLRLRPFASMRLEDFRINPQYMGEKYAYSETVRGAARKCLPGCTRPDCCGGAFMKAVQMNAPMNDDKSDAEVLEAYFGDNWQAIVGAYPADRRKSLLQEARASAFANQYGKHRNAFERQSTPPGFWRTDMPSTQEAADYRAQAEAEKKVQVEARWRDAMRGGGRWKFRDE